MRKEDEGMSSEKSFVRKVEQNVDDLFGGVRKRKPWLFYLLVAGFVTFGALYVFEKFLGIPWLKEQISAQERQIAELTRERDVKAGQLASFLATATKHQRQIPTDKIEYIRELLSKSKNRLQVDVSYLGSDRDAYSLATQIRNLFRESGWKVGEIEGALSFSAGAQPPLIVETYAELPPDIREVFVWIFASLGSKPSFELKTNIPQQSVQIFVGPDDTSLSR